MSGLSATLRSVLTGAFRGALRGAPKGAPEGALRGALRDALKDWLPGWLPGWLAGRSTPEMAKSGTNGSGKGQFGRIQPENGVSGPAGAIQTGFGAQNQPKPAQKSFFLTPPAGGRIY